MLITSFLVSLGIQKNVFQKRFATPWPLAFEDLTSFSTYVGDGKGGDKACVVAYYLTRLGTKVIGKCPCGEYYVFFG